MPEDPRFDADERRWAAWMAAANAGDKRAYEQLPTEPGDVNEAYIRHRFGQLNGLEDCVQESLLTLYKARRTYDPARPFRPSLFTLVRHKTIDLLRRGQRHACRADDNPAPPGDDGPRDRLNELIDGIRVLQRITPDHRNAVALTAHRSPRSTACCRPYAHRGCAPAYRSSRPRPGSASPSMA